MKQNILLAAVCAALIQGCASTSKSHEDSPSMLTTTSAAVAQPALPAYYWNLVSANDAAGKPLFALNKGIERKLRVSFGDKNLNISGGCNGQFGGYQYQDGVLKVQSLASTLMACDKSLMDLDAEVARLFKGDLRAVITGDNTAPMLQLTTANGSVLKLQGEATPQTRYGSKGEVKFLEVAAKTVKCSHPMIPDYQCLQVRERRYDDAGLQLATQDAWHPLYQSIEGFEHHDGVRTVLRVKQYEWKNPPADAPSKVYVLDMVVEQDASGTSQ
jgi:heat shock protein HslJ